MEHIYRVSYALDDDMFIDNYKFIVDADSEEQALDKASSMLADVGLTIEPSEINIFERIK